VQRQTHRRRQAFKPEQDRVEHFLRRVVAGREHVHAGVPVAEARNPPVVGDRDGRLAQLARLEHEQPRVRVCGVEVRLLRGPEGLAQRAHGAALLVEEAPAPQEEAERRGAGGERRALLRVVTQDTQAVQRDRVALGATALDEDARAR
jgi:hypothetical protein